MRLTTLSYLVLAVLCLVLTPAHCQRKPKPGGKNRCKKFNLENGKVKIQSRGRLAKLKCRKKYTMIEGDRFLSCVRQKWNGNVPKCIKSGCDEIYEIAHGTASELFQGALVQFHCNPGYALNGSPSLACNGNNWNASVPFCGHRIPQEEVLLTCNFETNEMCNWEVVNSPSDKGWKLEQGGQTMPGSSAPSIDHSTGTHMGHFMIVDSAAMGTRAQLFSPVFSPPAEAPTCFVFYYYIQEHAQNSISISYKPDNISIANLNSSVVLRGDSGRPREDGWAMYYFDLNPYIIIDQHFQIIIELLPGDGYNSDVAIDDVALASGSQCIDYELDYEEQQNSPNTTTIMSTTSQINIEDTSNSASITSTNITTLMSTTSLIKIEDTSYSASITSTDQDEEIVTYQTQTDELLDITSIMTTNDLQNEDLTSLPTTKITQETNTNAIITADNITDIKVNQTTTLPNTQTASSIISYQTTTDNLTTTHQPDILTLGPKVTLLPLTSPPVITILPPTTSTPLKQRTPETTTQIGTNITLYPTTSVVQQNNTKLPTKMPHFSTKSALSTDFISLNVSTKIVTTTVQNTLTSQTPSPSAFTPPPLPTLPPHPFSDISTSMANSSQELIPEIRTESTSFNFQTNSTESSSHTHKLTTHTPPITSSPVTLPSTFITSITSLTTPTKFIPPPPPPLPPHPFSEMTTVTTFTTNLSVITQNPIPSTRNNKQSTFFTDTTTHATSTLSTNEINSKPTTANEVMSTTKPITTNANEVTSTTKPTTTKKFTTGSTMDIMTTPKSTIKKIITETSSVFVNSPSTLPIEIVTIPKPNFSPTPKIGNSASADVNNKASKYSKGAIAAIAVLLLVLCVLGIIAISVVVKKYRDYAKEDQLLEDTEGSNRSISFSYRREGGGREGGGGGGRGEGGLPPYNFYGYGNPGTPV